ncbi:hypothetical protein GCM10020229_54150 [Kitasatospora albolonga]|uniref:RICIN domain-containing protein n=1 Tax=Kitasatospora albolonga TaxID=68173 RepID=UPI0031E5F842
MHTRSSSRRQLSAAFAAAVVAVATLAAMLVARPGPGRHQRPPLRGTGSNRCLDVQGASQADGAALQIYDCSGRGDQQWTATSTNQLTVVTAPSAWTSPNHATTAGTRVQIWPAAAERTSSGG